MARIRPMQFVHVVYRTRRFEQMVPTCAEHTRARLAAGPRYGGGGGAEMRLTIANG